MLFGLRISLRSSSSLNETNQVTAPLVPKIKGAGDTRHFQEYEENGNVFKIKADIVHAKEFEDF